MKCGLLDLISFEMGCGIMNFSVLFSLLFKTLFKGKNFAARNEKGVNSVLITILRFSACQEDNFQKKLSLTDLPLIFCKIGPRNTLFIFGKKMVVCFVCFVASLTDFGFLFFKLKKHSSS